MSFLALEHMDTIHPQQLWHCRWLVFHSRVNWHLYYKHRGHHWNICSVLWSSCCITNLWCVGHFYHDCCHGEQSLCEFKHTNREWTSFEKYIKNIAEATSSSSGIPSYLFHSCTDSCYKSNIWCHITHWKPWINNGPWNHNSCDGVICWSCLHCSHTLPPSSQQMCTGSWRKWHS